MLANLLTFLEQEDPDIITMQEVSAGQENLCSDKRIELFLYLRDSLGLNGAVAPLFYVKGDPDAYLGNAILVKGDILTQNTLWLNDYREVGLHETRDYEQIPRNALELQIDCGGKKFFVLSTHLVWTKDPIVTATKLQVAMKLVDYLKDYGDKPFLLGGDFNMPLGSEVVDIFNSVANNVVLGSQITRTTHPALHKTKDIYPRGLLVDFIFTSKHFGVKYVSAPVVDISDHLPVLATLTMY